MHEIEIKEVLFLTPAKIKAIVDGEEKTMMISVDIANRKAYADNGDSSISEKLFDYLDSIYVLPEDFFSAPQEVRDEVQDAYETQLEITEQSIERSMGFYE